MLSPDMVFRPDRLFYVPKLAALVRGVPHSNGSTCIPTQVITRFIYALYRKRDVWRCELLILIKYLSCVGVYGSYARGVSFFSPHVPVFGTVSLIWTRCALVPLSFVYYTWIFPFCVLSTHAHAEASTMIHGTWVSLLGRMRLWEPGFTLQV